MGKGGATAGTTDGDADEIRSPVTPSTSKSKTMHKAQSEMIPDTTTSSTDDNEGAVVVAGMPPRSKNSSFPTIPVPSNRSPFAPPPERRRSAMPDLKTLNEIDDAGNDGDEDADGDALDVEQRPPSSSGSAKRQPLDIIKEKTARKLSKMEGLVATAARAARNFVLSHIEAAMDAITDPTHAAHGGGTKDVPAASDGAPGAPAREDDGDVAPTANTSAADEATAAAAAASAVAGAKEEPVGTVVMEGAAGGATEVLENPSPSATPSPPKDPKSSASSRPKPSGCRRLSLHGQ